MHEFKPPELGMRRVCGSVPLKTSGMSCKLHFPLLIRSRHCFTVLLTVQICERSSWADRSEYNSALTDFTAVSFPFTKSASFCNITIKVSGPKV